MTTFTPDQWLVLLLVFLLGLFLGMAFLASPKWTLRYREEVARREAAEAETERLRREAAEMASLRQAAAPDAARRREAQEPPEEPPPLCPFRRCERGDGLGARPQAVRKPPAAFRWHQPIQPESSGTSCESLTCFIGMSVLMLCTPLMRASLVLWKRMTPSRSSA